MKDILIVLADNQNRGKTVFFNRLIGNNQHVGSFPGVIVEKKIGQTKPFREAALVDLPGTYFLSPYMNEEVVTRDFILKDNPSLIINIADATNIERNPYLSLWLMELQRPIVTTLNIMDEVTVNGNSIDVHTLNKYLRCPIVPISASKNEGIDKPVRVVKKRIRSGKQAVDLNFCKEEIHHTIHFIAHITEDHVKQAEVPMRFVFTKLVEGDEPIQGELKLHQDDTDITEKIVRNMEDALQTDHKVALADIRYLYIEELVADCAVKRYTFSAQVRSEKTDGLLAHKYLGIPTFILVMLCIFYLTFGPVGGIMQALLEGGIVIARDQVTNLLASMQASDWLQTLIIDGIYNGVGGVLSFFPVVVALFFFLPLLEDSEHMTRMALVMGKLLRKISLSGRSFVPMLIGFGCSVPVIMSACTLSSERDRKMIVIITPFMSCSAELPVYSMIIATFFPEHIALVLVSVYLIDILVAILSALLLKSTMFKEDSVPFIMELPSYRIPSARSVALHMWEKAEDFLRKAFTVISAANIVIWSLRSYSFSLTVVADFTDSMSASIGTWIPHMFAPLGLENWRASTALVAGITAKGSVASTLNVLTQTNSDAGLNATLQTIFTPVFAFAYLCSMVLYMPCTAAFVATRRELGSTRQALEVIGHQMLVVYLVTFLAFQIGSMFF